MTPKNKSVLWAIHCVCVCVCACMCFFVHVYKKKIILLNSKLNQWKKYEETTRKSIIKASQEKGAVVESKSVAILSYLPAWAAEKSSPAYQKKGTMWTRWSLFTKDGNVVNKFFFYRVWKVFERTLRRSDCQKGRHWHPMSSSTTGEH